MKKKEKKPVNAFNRIQYALIVVMAMLIFGIHFYSEVLKIDYEKYIITEETVVEHNGKKVFKGRADDYKFEDVKSEDILTVYMKVPNIQMDKPGLFYDNINASIQIYIDGDRVYTIGEMVEKGGIVCHAYNRVPVEKIAGQISEDTELKMVIRVMNDATFVRVPNVYLMDMEYMDRDYYQSTMVYAVMGTYLLILGIVGIIVCCLIWRKDDIHIKILVISIWSINCALYILSTFQVIPMFSDNLLLDAYMEYITKMLILVILNIYMCFEKQGKARISSYILTFVSTVYTIFAVVVQVTHTMYLNDTMAFYFMLMAIVGLDFIIYYIKNIGDGESKKGFLTSSSIVVLLFCAYGVVHLFLPTLSNYFVIIVPIALIAMITMIFVKLIEGIIHSMIDDAGKEALTRLAYIEKFTGLYNRRGLRNYVATKLDKSTSYDLYLVDLNGLKKVNDSYGHDAGDDLIKSFAKELQKSFETGFVARIGGDEFVALAKTSLNKEDMLLELKKNVALHNDESEKVYKLGYAIGVASFIPKKKSFNDALKEADEEMYINKKARKAAEQN